MFLIKLMNDLLEYSPTSFTSDEKAIDYLQNLYGADLDISCGVLDETKIFLCLSGKVLSDRFSLKPNEKLTEKFLKFMIESLLCADITDKNLFFKIMTEMLTEVDTIEDYVERAFNVIYPNTVSSVDHITSLSQIDFISYNTYKKFYDELLSSSEICIFCNGDVDDGFLYKYFKETFSKIERNYIKPINNRFIKLIASQSEVIVPADPGAFSNITVFFSVNYPKNSSKYIPAIHIFTRILQEELYNVACCQKGLAYCVSVEAMPYYGLIVVSAQVSNGFFYELLNCIRDEISDINLDRIAFEYTKVYIHDLYETLRNAYDSLSFNFLKYTTYSGLTDENIASITFDDIENFQGSVAFSSYYGEIQEETKEVEE